MGCVVLADYTPFFVCMAKKIEAPDIGNGASCKKLVMRKSYTLFGITVTLMA